MIPHMAFMKIINVKAIIIDRIKLDLKTKKYVYNKVNFVF